MNKNIMSLKSNDFLSFKSALGPVIFELLQNKDKNIEEIMRNPDGTVWVDRKGVGEELIGKVQSDIDAKRTIEIVASATKRICKIESPTVSGEIPGLKYRFQGMMPNNVESPAWTIRIPSENVFTLDDYVTNKIITQEQKVKLIEMIQGGWNILIVGGTSSGKTTFLNALLVESSKMNLRHILIEDTYELRCSAKNKVYLHSNEYASMEDLLEASMRLRPKIIIIGEAKNGPVAGTFLRACNTGHKGTKCTIHANSARDGLHRMEELLEEDGKSPSPRSIARAVQAVVYIEAAHDSTWRKVKEIVEVKGYHEGNYILNQII